MARLFHLEGFEGGEWHSPLSLLESCVLTSLVKVGLHVEHEIFRQNDEPSLVKEIGVPLDDECVTLVAVSWIYFHVLLEEVPPVERKHALDQVQDAELKRVHSLLLLQN